MIYCSVIIPTFNRFEKLLCTLDGFTKQVGMKQTVEIIVINDGSTDAAYAAFSELPKRYPTLQLIVVEQANAGAAAARNAGIAIANGTYILFLGDDTRPHPRLLAEHEASHRAHPDSIVLGFVDWDPDQPISPFMKFIAPNGPQFNFDIRDKLNVGYRRFYTSNISMKKEILPVPAFRTDFPGCNWEDIELGYVLEQQGIHTVFNEAAIVYHDHYYELDGFLKRQRSVGVNKKIFLDLHPELKNIWSNRLFLRWIILYNQFKLFIGRRLHIDRWYYTGACTIAWIRGYLES